MDEPDFTALNSLQITIVGLGLMGGSLALRLKRDALCRRVVALVRRPEAAVAAEARHAVDMATTDPALALADADVVIFSTPVRVLVSQVSTFAPFLKAGAIVTDVGSTKRRILAALDNLPPTVHPVGSHPMCGKETSGLAAADPALYDGATWVVAPLERTPPHAVETISLLARAVGAKPLPLLPARHDKLVAAISHLPYLLSAGLVRTVQQVADDDPMVWQVAASGFKDTSRLAASDVTMMLDILLTNADMVIAMLNRFGGELSAFVEALVAEDETRLRTMLMAAQTCRTELYPPEAT